MIIENLVEIDVPAEFAYSQLTDLRLITEHSPSNTTFRSTSSDNQFTVGSTWRLQVARGMRKFTIDSVIEVNEPNKLVKFNSKSTRMESNSTVEILDIEPEFCHIKFRSELKPNGILGRILIQSLRASQRRIDERLERFNSRVADFLEERYQAIQK